MRHQLHLLSGLHRVDEDEEIPITRVLVALAVEKYCLGRMFELCGDIRKSAPGNYGKHRG